ncbi:MAG TPA: hypothetical protein VIK80_13040 [Flavihumibacter sp.]|jgi:chromosome segregation ATPase
MVTTEISQLSGECTKWVNTLRSSRSAINALKEKLQSLSPNLHDRERLKDLEHLQNQFYIQLINIHDLKHAIKEHDQIAQWELQKRGHVSDATIATHEELADQFDQLMGTLEEVKSEFNRFVEQGLN